MTFCSLRTRASRLHSFVWDPKQQDLGQTAAGSNRCAGRRALLLTLCFRQGAFAPHCSVMLRVAFGGEFCRSTDQPKSTYRPKLICSTFCEACFGPLQRAPESRVGTAGKFWRCGSRRPFQFHAVFSSADNAARRLQCFCNLSNHGDMAPTCPGDCVGSAGHDFLLHGGHTYLCTC
jgi:hypothetical protein